MKTLNICSNCGDRIQREEERKCENCGAYLCGQCICHKCENELVDFSPLTIIEAGEERERILCAAIWYKEYGLSQHQPINIEKGFVMCGHRHSSIIGQCAALTELKQSEMGVIVQGFLTDKNRFVDRKEALKIAEREKQIIHNVPIDSEIGLTSEDIY